MASMNSGLCVPENYNDQPYRGRNVRPDGSLPYAKCQGIDPAGLLGGKRV